MYDFIFLPFNGREQSTPVTLLEKVICAGIPNAWDVPELLYKYNKSPRTQGIILIVSHSNPETVFGAYWGKPCGEGEDIRSSVNAPPPLPQITFKPLPRDGNVKKTHSSPVGERTQEAKDLAIVLYALLTIIVIICICVKGG